MFSRPDTAAARQASAWFRTARDSEARRRRAAAGSALLAAGALGVVALYQLRLVRHLPDPPVPGFDSDTVDASGEAYVYGSAPDAVLGAASALATAALITLGGPRQSPPLATAAAVKCLADAAGSAALFVEQLDRRRALCFWCVVAAAAHLATVPLTLPQALRALRGAG